MIQPGSREIRMGEFSEETAAKRMRAEAERVREKIDR
jgi:hypothetical protein